MEFESIGVGVQGSRHKIAGGHVESRILEFSLVGSNSTFLQIIWVIWRKELSDCSCLLHFIKLLQVTKCSLPHHHFHRKFDFNQENISMLEVLFTIAEDFCRAVVKWKFHHLKFHHRKFHNRKLTNLKRDSRQHLMRQLAYAYPACVFILRKGWECLEFNKVLHSFHTPRN